MIDRIKDFLTTDEPAPQQQHDADQPSDQEEELREQLEQEQQAREELQNELEEVRDSQAERAARVEENLAEEKQEKKELEQQLQQERQKRQRESEREVSSPDMAPPLEHDLKGTPVYSATGEAFFGTFVEWTRSRKRGKVGMICDVPGSRNQRRKVGWTDTYDDLIVDTVTMSEKDAIIVALDGNMQPIDLVNARRHQEIKQNKQEAEQRANRLSQEVNKLQERNEQLQQQVQKLMTMMSMQKLQSGRDIDQDMEMMRIQNQRDIDKAHMEDLSTKNQATRGRTQRLIQDYEQAMDDTLGEATMSDTEKAMDQVEDIDKRTLQRFQQMWNQLPPQMQEQMIQQAQGGGGGGMVFDQSEES